MRRGDVARAKGIQPAQGLLRSALASAFALVFSIERMQAPGIGRHTVEAKQDLVEQVRAAFWEGNAKQDRPPTSRLGYGYKTSILHYFFNPVKETTKKGF